jgi:DNA primase
MVTVTLEQALAKGHGQWRSFTCPKHEDANPSARVNTTTGKWVCMVCHAKGTTQGYVPDYDRIVEEALEALDAESLEKPESWLDQYDSGPVHEYWLSRFPEEVCRTYRLGWDGVKEKPCYPVRATSGRPLGVTHRNLDHDGPKYKYPKGVLTSELLFGVEELQQTHQILIVEGAMDVVAVREAGHDAVGTYGSALYPQQVKQIVALEPRMVWIAYDMDRAGHIGASDAEWSLSLAGVLCRRLFWDDRYSDLGEMDIKTRTRTLSNALAFHSTVN